MFLSRKQYGGIVCCVLFAVGLGLWDRAPQRMWAWRLYRNAIQHLTHRQVDRALTSLERALSYHPRFVLARCLRGRLFFEQRKWKRAEQELRQALRVQPNAVCGLFLLGQVRDSLRDRKGALRAYSHALRGKANRLWGSTAVLHYWVYRYRAKLYLSSRQYARAAADYTRAIGIRPKPYKLWKLRAKCRMHSHQPKGAAEDLRRFLKFQPYDEQSHYLLGLLYHRLGKPKLALVHLKRALKLHPTRDLRRAMIWYARAVVDMEAGRWRKAEAAATQSIWSAKTFAPAYGIRGMIYMGQRDFRRALQDCYQLLKLNANLHGYSPVCRLLVLAVRGDQKSFLKAYKAWQESSKRQGKHKQDFGWKLVRVRAFPKLLEQFLESSSTRPVPKAKARRRKLP